MHQRHIKVPHNWLLTVHVIANVDNCFLLLSRKPTNIRNDMGESGEGDWLVRPYVEFVVSKQEMQQKY